MVIVRSLILSLLALTVSAQTWDSSGNSKLSGTWYFRNVVYLVGDSQGNLKRALAAYGQITFSGTGTYTLSSKLLDSDSNSIQDLNTTGTYAISASGYGWISHPLSTGDYVFGLVSNDVFIGSASEAGFNDLFVAARLGNTGANVSALRGSYTLSYIDFSSFSPYSSYDSLWKMSPDGNGNLGTVSLQTYVGGNGSTPYGQNLTGVKYIFSNGAANMQFPRSSNALLSGSEYLYLSPDGNFVFGGSPETYDFFVGVRNSTGSATLSGLYYQGGVDVDSGSGTLTTYYGALSAGAGAIIGHQRTLNGFNSSASNYTYYDSYNVGSDGSYNDVPTYTQYYVGSGGIRIGLGVGPYLGISAAIPAGPFSGSGVYINPAGIVNAASSAPFTEGIAPGELITIYGSNLADSTVVAPGIPFPTTLGNVQVKINGVTAPIYFVSAGQVSVIVPFGLTAGIAEIQVINNGTASNVVTEYTDATAPGVFTVNPVGGIGYAAALHSDYSLVTTSNPAHSGEYIAVYVTGLGTVSPAINDGDAGPVNPFSTTTNTIGVYVGGTATTTTYVGLAPQLAGLYQINFVVPTVTSAGDVSLGISGPDSYTTEALIPVAP